MSCHGIFQQSFHLLSQKKSKGPGGAVTMHSLLEGILHDLTGSDDPFHHSDPPPSSENAIRTTPTEAASAPFTVPELPVTKVQGVRALKSNAWIQRRETRTEILCAVWATQPVQVLSAWLLKAQGDKCWLSKNVVERPLVNLATPHFSPVVSAMTDAINMMSQNQILAAPYPMILLNRNSVHTCPGNGKVLVACNSSHHCNFKKNRSNLVSFAMV